MRDRASAWLVRVSECMGARSHTCACRAQPIYTPHASEARPHQRLHHAQRIQVLARLRLRVGVRALHLQHCLAQTAQLALLGRALGTRRAGGSGSGALDFSPLSLHAQRSWERRSGKIRRCPEEAWMDGWMDERVLAGSVRGWVGGSADGRAAGMMWETGRSGWNAIPTRSCVHERGRAAGQALHKCGREPRILSLVPVDHTVGRVRRRHCSASRNGLASAACHARARLRLRPSRACACHSVGSCRRSVIARVHVRAGEQVGELERPLWVHGQSCSRGNGKAPVEGKGWKERSEQ